MTVSTATPTLDRNALAVAHLAFARKVAGATISPMCRGAQRDDLIADGLLGLAEAAARFRPETGANFSAYAAKRVRGAVLDSLRGRDPLTRSQRRKVKGRPELVPDYQREPVHFSTVVGLENTVRTPEILTPSHGLPPAVADALRALPPRLRRVLIETSANGRTLRDVAADLGMTESGVCRARQRALALVRRSLGEKEVAA